MIHGTRIIVQKMMRMTSIKSIFIVMIILDLALVGFSLYKGGLWLINSQLAVLSSLLVTVASYFSYKRVVEKRVKLEMESYDDRSELDKIEDPYDLYGEDDVNEDLDLKEVIKEERAKVVSLKATANNLAKSIGGALSIFRLLSYLFLFVSFLYLVNNQLFMVWAYVSGLFVVPLSALVFALLGRK
jgi:hypothetical protein